MTPAGTVLEVALALAVLLRAPQQFIVTSVHMNIATLLSRTFLQTRYE